MDVSVYFGPEDPNMIFAGDRCIFCVEGIEAFWTDPTIIRSLSPFGDLPLLFPFCCIARSKETAAAPYESNMEP